MNSLLIAVLLSLASYGQALKCYQCLSIETDPESTTALQSGFQQIVDKFNQELANAGKDVVISGCGADFKTYGSGVSVDCPNSVSCSSINFHTGLTVQDESLDISVKAKMCGATTSGVCPLIDTFKNPTKMPKPKEISASLTCLTCDSDECNSGVIPTASLVLLALPALFVKLIL